MTAKKNSTHYLLALDQATTTGWCVFNQRDAELVKFGTYTCKGKNPGSRFFDFYNWLNKMIEEYAPRQIVCEDIFSDIGDEEEAKKGFITQKILAGYLAIIQMICSKQNIPLEVVIASHWKRILGVSGRSRGVQKESCKTIVNKYYNVDSQDAADAIGIAYSVLFGGKTLNEIEEMIE